MPENKTTDETNEAEKVSKSYSLDESGEGSSNHSVDTDDSGSQKHGVMVIVIVLVLIVGFFFIQAFSGSEESVVQETEVASQEETVDYEYVEVVTDELIGDYLRDTSSKLTLYTVDIENCPSQCMTQWVPYAGLEELNYSSVTSELDDFEFQYHYSWKGEKLYYYVPDELPGDVLGENFYFVGKIARP
jgi:predicted lipoprotein with Yx(FWY)xxD motif